MRNVEVAAPELSTSRYVVSGFSRTVTVRLKADTTYVLTVRLKADTTYGRLDYRALRCRDSARWRLISLASGSAGFRRSAASAVSTDRSN
jgi:hypothetical protein